MDVASPDKAFMDPSVAINVLGEEEGASADYDKGASDGNESKLLYNVPKTQI